MARPAYQLCRRRFQTIATASGFSPGEYLCVGLMIFGVCVGLYCRPALAQAPVQGAQPDAKAILDLFDAKQRAPLARRIVRDNIWTRVDDSLAGRSWMHEENEVRQDSDGRIDEVWKNWMSLAGENVATPDNQAMRHRKIWDGKKGYQYEEVGPGGKTRYIVLLQHDPEIANRYMGAVLDGMFYSDGGEAFSAIMKRSPDLKIRAMCELMGATA